jgi:hypothetical protein
MAALLPSLVSAANMISGGGTASGNPIPTGTPAYAPGAATTVNMMDPCAFKYEYRNKWNFEPVCTCLGYRFDMRQHRCVRANS